MIKAKILLPCLIAFAGNAVADEIVTFEPELNVKFGGWSHHNPESFDTYKYTENHRGIGFDLTLFKSSNDRHGFGLAYFQMNDSFNMENIQGGFLYTYSPKVDIPVIRNIEYNLGIGAMKRGWIHRYVKYDYNDYYFTSRTTPIAFPYITYNINEFLNFDVFYIPQLNATMPKSTWFVRGGININSIIEKFG